MYGRENREDWYKEWVKTKYRRTLRLDPDQTGSGKLIAAVAVWLLLFAASCGPTAPTVAPTEPTASPEASGPMPRPRTEILSKGIVITFGRAVLRPDGRATLFYAANDMSGKYEEAVAIDRAEMTDSDGRSVDRQR